MDGVSGHLHQVWRATSQKGEIPLAESIMHPSDWFERIEELTPAAGYNVVVVDEYGSADQQGPYLLCHCATRAQAEGIATWNRAQSSERVYIYAAEQT